MKRLYAPSPTLLLHVGAIVIATGAALVAGEPGGHDRAREAWPVLRAGHLQGFSTPQEATLPPLVRPVPLPL
jgi:hypothetical protein